MTACPGIEAMQAVVEGEATPHECEAIELHARDCAACRDALMLAQTRSAGSVDTGGRAGAAAGVERDAPPVPGARGARGMRIDRFVVEGVLGAGGMGVVYAARDPELGRRVALKLLRDESAHRRERLTREAQALAQVAHPNVCAVHELGTHAGRLFIAMELVEGKTLAGWLRAQPRSWREVVAVFAAAARGLAAAHGAGVIHRDFKPDNVLVGDDGRVRVTDFGLAAVRPALAAGSTEGDDAGDGARGEGGGEAGDDGADAVGDDGAGRAGAVAPGRADAAIDMAFGAAARADASTIDAASGAVPGIARHALTRTGALLGTPLYMAPEQHAREPAGAHSDQWSFAAALYEALHGELPFAGATVAELARAKASGARRAAPRGSRAPRWLHRLVHRGLSVRRADRWPSMTVLADALDRGVARRGRVWAAALAGAVAIAAIAIAVTRPSDGGTDAARLAALAESMEAGVRIERLAPPHDLRPAMQRIRGEVDRLRPEAAAGSAVASFALGKGLELLGDDTGARDAYRRAWDGGFRLPSVADGLGSVLSSLYRREAAAARGVLTGATLDERLAALDRELAAPAARYLAAGGGEPWRIALHRATIALLARDYPATRAAAADALAADPGRYEALALQAEAWRGEAMRRTDRRERGEPLRSAIAAADAAAQYARSDQRMALLAIDLRTALLLAETLRGDPIEGALAQLSAALDAAAAIDPDAPALLVSRGKLVKQQAHAAQYAGVERAMPLFVAATAALRRAAELDGGQVGTLAELAQDLSVQADAVSERGDPAGALPLLDEGLRAIERALALEQRSGMLHARAQQLHKNKARSLGRLHRAAAWLDELRHAIDAGDTAIRLGYADVPTVQVMTGMQRIELAGAAWRDARDPRPEARRGLALVAEGEARSAGDLWAISELIAGHARVAEQLLELGDDPSDLIEAARSLAERALAHHPELAIVRQHQGWLAVLDGRHRLAAGRDPSTALALAERLLAASVAATDNDQGRRSLAELAIIRARWLARRGSDPAEPLRTAHTAIAAAATRQPGWGDDLTAAAALEAARFARRTGGPASDATREGLAALDRILAGDPRDATLWSTRAALSALAGDAAISRANLARAVSLNPLVRDAPAFRDAEALQRDLAGLVGQ